MGWSLLHITSRYGNENVVKCLVEHEVDVK